MPMRQIALSLTFAAYTSSVVAQTCASSGAVGGTANLLTPGDVWYKTSLSEAGPPHRVFWAPKLTGWLRGPPDPTIPAGDPGPDATPAQEQTLFRALGAMEHPLQVFQTEFPAAIGPGKSFNVTAADLGMIGDNSFTLGVVFPTTIQDNGAIPCRLYVDYDMTNTTTGSTATDANIHGVPNADAIEVIAAHEGFHCVQQFLLNTTGPTASLPLDEFFVWEATARWSEHLVYPDRQTEWTGSFGMRHWVSQPQTPWFDRSESAVFPYMYADLKLGKRSVLKDMISQAGALNDARAAFENVFLPGIGGAAAWHDISVAGWNQEPVEIFSESGRSVLDPPCFQTEHLAEYEEVEISVDLEPYSRINQKIHLTPGTDGTPKRVGLDLSALAATAEGHITALIQTTDGWLDPVLLTGETQVEICAEKSGPCAWPTAGVKQIHADDELQSITLIITNADGTAISGVKVRVNSHNPVLTGNWQRVGASVRAGLNFAPFEIVGTGLSFAEPTEDMSESTGAFGLIGGDISGWACNFTGAYTIGIGGEYDRDNMSGANGTGVVTIRPGRRSLLSPWSNKCLFTGEGAEIDIKASNIHVPVAAIPPPHKMRFELGAEGNRLVVWPGTPAPSVVRKYTYQRLN